jgi:OFA family oxalate/formate antiporter-like MFS transporter
VLLGLGLLVSGLAGPRSHAPMTLGFGVLTGSGIALAFVSTFPAAAKWFPPNRRGLVTGLVVSGFGIASVYIAPLTDYLLITAGIRQTFFALGAGFLVATVALAQLIKNPPPGYIPPHIGVEDVKAETSCPPARRDYDWHQMVRTRQFVLLWLMYGLTAFAGIMIIGHLAKITLLQTGLDLGFMLVAVLALGNASGRIVAGIVTDRIGAVRTMTIVFALQAVMMGLVGFAESAYVLSGVAFVIGFNYGADLALFPCVVSEYFGQANQGVNYGVVFTSWGVGGVFGSMAAGAIVDATGSYALAFALAAVMCLLAAGLSVATHPPAETQRGRLRGALSRWT